MNPTKRQRHIEACLLNNLRISMHTMVDLPPTADEMEKFKKIVWYMVIGAFILVAGCSSTAHAESYNDRAVKAIIGEAENQGEKGMLLIACGIYNRGTLKGVYGEKAPRVIKKRYSKSVYQQAKTAWELVNEVDGWTYCTDIKGASFWENTKQFGEPYWVKDMVETYRYKDHVFYRKKIK